MFHCDILFKKKNNKHMVNIMLAHFYSSAWKLCLNYKICFTENWQLNEVYLESKIMQPVQYTLQVQCVHM